MLLRIYLDALYDNGIPKDEYSMEQVRERETQTETDRERDRERDRDTERQIEKRDREIQRYRDPSYPRTATIASFTLK